MEEYGTWLGLASALGIPLLVKYNVLMPVAYGCQVASGKECDGIIISNTYPWNSLPGEVRRKYFGSTVSPLDKYGGGGLSAPWLRPFVLRWITEARALGFTKPIIACGAIHHWKHAKEYLDAGADAVKIGSVAMVRPWCVAGIIRFVNDYCKRREG